MPLDQPNCVPIGPIERRSRGKRELRGGVRCLGHRGLLRSTRSFRLDQGPQRQPHAPKPTAHQ